MKERLIHIGAMSFSVLLLSASIGVILWIVRDEHSRLADRERAAIEAAQEATRQEALLVGGDHSASTTGAENIFRDIDTLLSGLSNDDLPVDD